MPPPFPSAAQATPPYSLVHDENQFDEFVNRLEILSRHPSQFVTTIQEPVPMRHKHFQVL